MTRLLKEAIQLPEPEQNAIAASILSEIDDERRWAEGFDRSPEVLADLAREALAKGGRAERCPSGSSMEIR